MKIDMPPMPRLKKGEIAIMHPAVEQLLDFVADHIFKDLVAEHAARLRGEPSATGDAAIEPTAETEQEYKKPDYEIITVDEGSEAVWHDARCNHGGVPAGRGRVLRSSKAFEGKTALARKERRVKRGCDESTRREAPRFGASEVKGAKGCESPR